MRPRLFLLLNQKSEWLFGCASHLSCTRVCFLLYAMNVAQISVPGGHHWGVLPRAASPLQNTAAVAVGGYQLWGYYPIANLPFRPLRIVNAGANNHVGVCHGVWSRVEAEFGAALKLSLNRQMRWFVIRMRANFSLGSSCFRQMLYA